MAEQPKKWPEIYTITLNCSNCGYMYRVEIPKGVRISEYTTSVSCPNCGCSYRDSWATLRPPVSDYELVSKGP